MDQDVPVSQVRGEPWFDDGNIVLVAENTAFCVHKAQLARQSEIFKGMFSAPQTSTAAARYEGRDVVHVHDPAKDLRNLLNALYDGVCVAPSSQMHPLIRTGPPVTFTPVTWTTFYSLQASCG